MENDISIFRFQLEITYKILAYITGIAFSES